MRRIQQRFLGEESGFTLPELMVTIMVMLTVFFALHSIFDMSIRVFGFGNDKMEATENARLGLERMEREIRAAYPYDKANGNAILLTTWDANRITFGNDTNGNRAIDANEIITFRRGISDPTTLIRESNGTSGPVVEFVDGLSFEFLDRYGCRLGNLGCPTTNEANIYTVRITLTIEVDRGLSDPTAQTLTTDVALRNRTN
jgi:prepilin-type N-terminal cleavage/methylation domain-containing protein